MSLFCMLILAQVQPITPGPIVVKDEGVRVGAGSATTINCSGAGITCTKSGPTMTVTVPGGGTGGSSYDGGKVSEAYAADASAWSQTAERAGSAYSADASYTAQQAAVSNVAFSADASYTAQIFDHDPSACGANQYATDQSNAGALTCSQVGYSQLTGAPTIPTDISAAGYWTKTTEASLSNEVSLGALGTGLVINTTTTGIPTIMGAQTCTNQFARSSTASGTWTCAAVADADLASSYSGVGACAANTVATTLNDNGAPTCTALTSSYLPTVPVTKGGTNLTTVSANQVLVGTAADTFTAKTVPSCSNGTTDKLLFDNATQTWSCGTDQGGAGSGISYAEAAAANLAGF